MLCVFQVLNVMNCIDTVPVESDAIANNSGFMRTVVKSFNKYAKSTTELLSLLDNHRSHLMIQLFSMLFQLAYNYERSKKRYRLMLLYFASS